MLEVYWKIGEVQRGLGGEWHNKHGKSQLEEHTLAGATFSFQTMISCREFTPTRLTTGLGNVSCGSQPWQVHGLLEDNIQISIYIYIYIYMLTHTCICHVCHNLCKIAGGANVCVSKWYVLLEIIYKYNLYIYIDVCIYIYHVGANFSKKPGEQNVCFLIICIVERQYIYIYKWMYTYIYIYTYM